MKLELLGPPGLADDRVSATDSDKSGKEEGGRTVGDEEGGGRETLFQLRKRSRKRRSFVETDYTSMVSYPEPDPEMQDPVSGRLYKNLMDEANEAQILSSDPEPSEQTQNPSPTVASLTHSEGEPNQLESKPIWSKPHSHGPGSPCGLGSREHTGDHQARKQDMEMEPDAMESKSVTALAKAASPTITAVRRRVDPDGKESADRRGDRKEEGEELKETSEREEEEEAAAVSGERTFTNHMFLPDITEEEAKGEEEKKEGEMSQRYTDKAQLHLDVPNANAIASSPMTNSEEVTGSTNSDNVFFDDDMMLASGCESVVEGVQVPLDACGCPTVYTNCFGSGDSFDEELTVYEFSCRSPGDDGTSGASVPLVTSPPMASFLSTSSTHSPSFPRSNLFSSSTSELSPLLSPVSDSPDRFLPQTHKDTISRLGQQRYPEPPTGFQVLRVDVDQLLSILESTGADRSAAGHGGRHLKDTCPAHFTENKRVLQIEARRLMSGCQKVVGIGQSPEEMLHSLADSFRTLVELAGICLWFSGCERCDRRNAEAVAGLSDVARSFRDFCLAAERASSKRSCQDLSSKLLAKQCTALTASVFCLTQLFRTLTAL
ncbi:FERM and PDZ domain-containing protein 1 [Liparis tanakae]|uniref:FERM and PDZ domain-containing protein 1 n=1 Tax=Liparis tanakae TaxID=230148 RepID=A0A4Z2EYT7_9TELE|nr:FERM and PDZ domain-containing protein 1 [Liparis tanakae]